MLQACIGGGRVIANRENCYRYEKNANFVRDIKATMKKHWILLLLSLISAIPGASQSIKDYFYRRNYTVIDEYGRSWPTEKAINIIPLNRGDAQYEHRLSSDGSELKISYLYDEGSSFYSNWNTLASTTHKLEYQDDAIYSVSQRSYNPLSDSIDGNDRVAFIVLPGSTWEEKHQGDKYQCSSEWAYLSTKSSVYKAIKITKTLVGSQTSLDGVTEISYWAEGLGLVLRVYTTESGTKIDSYRINMESLAVISEDDYIKLNAWYSFVDEQENHLFYLRQLREDAYFYMESEFAKSILQRENGYEFVFKLTDGISFENVSTVAWPSVDRLYESTVTMTKNGVDEDQSFGDPFRWFLGAYRNLLRNTNFEYPYVTEPVSGRKYYCKLRDKYSVTETISSSFLTFKKGKNGYDLKKGDESIWKACGEKLQPYIANVRKEMDNPFDMLFAPNQLRIIKSTCANHTAYYVARRSWINSGYVYCEVDLLVID